MEDAKLTSIFEQPLLQLHRGSLDNSQQKVMSGDAGRSETREVVHMVYIFKNVSLR